MASDHTWRRSGCSGRSGARVCFQHQRMAASCNLCFRVELLCSAGGRQEMDADEQASSSWLLRRRPDPRRTLLRSCGPALVATCWAQCWASRHKTGCVHGPEMLDLPSFPFSVFRFPFSVARLLPTTQPTCLNFAFHETPPCFKSNACMSCCATMPPSKWLPWPCIGLTQPHTGQRL